MKVGDVVYCEGSSAILGDVESLDEDEGLAVVRWRTAATTELLDDLTVEPNPGKDEGPAAPWLSFPGEASTDAFWNVVGLLPNYAVTLILEGEAEPVEAILVGPDLESGWGGTVRFIRVADGEYDRSAYPDSLIESAVAVGIEVA